jgi:Peptidase C39 family
MYDLLALLLGTILCAASFLKLEAALPHDLAADTAVSIAVLWAAGLSLAELILGLVLAARINRRTTRLVAIAVFSCFAVYAFYQSAKGAETCGCLGDLTVNPLWMGFVDLAAVIALVALKPGNTEPNAKRATVSVLTVLGLGGVLCWISPSVSASLRTAAAAHLHSSDKQGEPFEINPEGWVGIRCPLLEFIDIKSQLSNGDWDILLHRPGCSLCESALLRKLEDLRVSGDKGSRLAVIEVPTDSAHAGFPPLADERIVVGHLSDARQWRFSPPVELRIHDSVVEAPTTEHQRYPNYLAECRAQAKVAVTCGPASLVTILRHLEKAPTVAALNEIYDAAGSKGTSLSDLKRLAEKNGVYAAAVELSGQDLVDLRLPAIVHLKNSVFAAAIGFSPSGITIAWPHSEERLVSLSQFRDLFGGPRARAVNRGVSRSSSKTTGEYACGYD